MDGEDRLAPGVLEQLRALPLNARRPLLVLDADEVLVDFAGHLGRFAAARGVAMTLARYELQGAFRDAASGRMLDFDEVVGLIDAFFHEETERQAALPGAVEAVRRLSEHAQVVVLTNVPLHGREARRRNLAALGIDAPMVQNAGGKGRPLAWMLARAGRPAAFVDDSPNQIGSVRRRAPEVLRLHFTGSPTVAGIIPECEDAHHRVADWTEAAALLADHFS